MALRVLIIDGHPAVGRGLEALLESMPELAVVGVSQCPVRGHWQALRARPDAVLVDAELPGLCSAAAIRLLRARLPETRVVALGVYPERRAAALGAGAHAFRLKDAGCDALRAAIGGDRECNNPASRPVESQADPIVGRAASRPAGVAAEVQTR
jgi:DNA-binding NarL/FixJ family response regulator